MKLICKNILTGVWSPLNVLLATSVPLEKICPSIVAILVFVMLLPLTKVSFRIPFRSRSALRPGVRTVGVLGLGVAKL